MWNQQVAPRLAAVLFFVSRGVLTPNNCGACFGLHRFVGDFVGAFGFANDFFRFRLNHEIRLVLFIIAERDWEIARTWFEPFESFRFVF